MLERGEAIGLLVILAVMLLATVYVAVRRTPSFGVVFAPVELALAGWVTATAQWDEPGGGSGPGPGPREGPPRSPGSGTGGGWGGGRGARRPRASSGGGATTPARW